MIVPKGGIIAHKGKIYKAGQELPPDYSSGQPAKTEKKKPKKEKGD